MGAAVERAHLPGVIERGALVAGLVRAALVFDVNHALRLVLGAEDAALLPGEVEVGHALAAVLVALAVLWGDESE